MKKYLDYLAMSIIIVFGTLVTLAIGALIVGLFIEWTIPMCILLFLCSVVWAMQYISNRESSK